MNTIFNDKKVRDKCFSFLKDAKLSEEFANDILSKAYEKINGFKGNSSFSLRLIIYITFAIETNFTCR